jgi:hypothetical protein
MVATIMSQTGIWLVLGMGTAFACVPVFAQQQPPAADIAAQVRLQGYPCTGSVSIQADPELSRPDERGWILTCTDGTYRVRLIPDMAARIEKLK